MENTTIRKVRGPVMGTTLYAFTLEWRSGKYTLETMLAEVAKRKLCNAVEVIGFQSIKGFPDVSTAFVKDFRNWMDHYELVPSSLAINADIAIRRGEKLSVDETVEYVARQIETAAKLGFSVVRSQMTAKAPVMRKLLPVAEKYKIKVGNELHSPYTLLHPEVIALRKLYEELQTPWLGFVPDFGNSMRAIPKGLLNGFRKDGVTEPLIDLIQQVWLNDLPTHEKYSMLQQQGMALGGRPAQLGRLNMVLSLFSRQKPEEWLEVMPQIVHVHGKFYSMENGEEPSIDYPALMKIFKQGGYNGYISSEWEGHLFTDEVSGFDMVKAHQEFCTRLLAEA
jgi:sugar phosphate isomerase/epimerase